MPKEKRDQSSILGGGSTVSDQTLLFPGVASKVVDDGRLIAWSYYAQSAGSMEVQVWRSTGVADQYSLVYTRTVSASGVGFQYEDVQADDCDVLKDDIVGISFTSTTPTPIFDVPCAYTESGSAPLTQTGALTYGSHISSMPNIVDFTNDGTCKDYLVQALVRYYCEYLTKHTIIIPIHNHIASEV